jgi:hypothetical protein
VSLLRGPDGVLHAAWHVRTGPNTDDLDHTAISPAGVVGATSPIVTGFATIENPALVPDPGGLRVFFGGIRSTNPGEPNQELNTATSTDNGASWNLQIGSVVPAGAQAYGSPVSAALLADGTPIETWAGSLGTWAHAGLDPATPNHDFQAPLGNYGYDTGIAAAGGRAVMAWYSNATGHLGVFAQDVAADGSPVGAAVNMPNTADMQVGMIGRTPIVARPGGGFYVAYATGYPTLNRIRLWPVGKASITTVAKTTANATASEAAAPDGRIWVVWTDQIKGEPHVFARRSNPDVTEFGAPIDAGRPTGGTSAYRLDASVAPAGLDVFGTFGIGTTPGVQTYYTRVLPGLTLKASPHKLHRGHPSTVTFTVRDAGDPVAGAKVSAGGQSDTTNSKGKTPLTLTGSGQSVTAHATHNGYTAGEVKLTVAR